MQNDVNSSDDPELHRMIVQILIIYMHKKYISAWKKTKQFTILPILECTAIVL
jgi:hypothetical protein